MEELEARQEAALEAVKAFKKVSSERQRVRMVAQPNGEPEIDITEDVVSLMDRITETLDWGSGFFTDEDLTAFFKLADLLKIDVPVSVERPKAREL